MHTYTKMKHTILILLIVIVLLFCLFVMSGKTASTHQELLVGKEFALLETETIPSRSIPLLMVTEKEIVLFYGSEGVVNIYNFSGDYLYGFQVEALRNGVADMAFDKEYLYINTKGNTMYVFNGPTLIRCFRRSQDPEAYEKLEQKLEGATCNTDGVANYFYNEANHCVEKIQNGYPIETVICLPLEHEKANTESVVLVLLLVSLVTYYFQSKMR